MLTQLGRKGPLSAGFSQCVAMFNGNFYLLGYKCCDRYNRGCRNAGLVG